MASRSALTRVFVDTCIFLDLVTKESALDPFSGQPRWKHAAELFRLVDAGALQLVHSPVILAELFAAPPIRDNHDQIQDLIFDYINRPETIWTDVTFATGLDSRELAAQVRGLNHKPGRRMGGADLLHVLSASQLGCAYLITQDGGFPLGHKLKQMQILSHYPLNQLPT